ncbi:MAG: 2-hydroxyacid dehydrogenase [Proteobacteria bacterium]|nr:2-hydroxyacid dehydrogenase [Pseudomonadota bacterium]
MSKPAILIHPPLGLFEMQIAALYDVVHLPTDRRDIQACVTIGSVGFGRPILDALPELKAIVCFGVGVDGIDLDYCRRRGIAVSNGPNINNEDVADVAMGLIISVARAFTQGERVLRDGSWQPPLAVPPQRRLSRRKLGIVGMGAIGQALAQRAKGFGLEIKWFGPHAKAGVAHPYEPDLIRLASWADIIAVCARGDKSTEKLVDARVIEALGSDGLLVNVSRGSVIDEDALIAALKAGKLGGAGLDVFQDEPTPVDRWRGVPNTTLTPHLGGATREALFAGSQNVLENLRRAIAGEPLLTPLW